MQSRAEARLLTPAFVLLLGTQFSFGLAFSTFLIFPKYLVTALHAGPAEVGRISALPALVAVIGVPVVARLVDRRSRRALMLAGAALMGVASLAMTAVDSLGPLVYTLRAVQGLSFLLFWNAAATLVTDLAPPARLAQALGWFALGALVTNALAPALAEPLADSRGWPFVFGLAAVCSVFAVLLSAGVRESQGPPPSRSGTGLGELLGARGIGVLYATVIMGAGFGAVVTFAQPLAIALGAREVSGLFVGYTVLATTVRLGLSHVADRFGRLRVALGASALYTLVVFGCAALRVSWLWWIGAGLGVAHGLLYPALNALAVEHAPASRRGSSMTLFTGAFSAGFGLSVLGFGSLAAVVGYRGAFAVAGCLGFSSLLVLTRLPPAPAA